MRLHTADRRDGSSAAGPGMRGPCCSGRQGAQNRPQQREGSRRAAHAGVRGRVTPHPAEVTRLSAGRDGNSGYRVTRGQLGLHPAHSGRHWTTCSGDVAGHICIVEGVLAAERVAWGAGGGPGGEQEAARCWDSHPLVWLPSTGLFSENEGLLPKGPRWERPMSSATLPLRVSPILRFLSFCRLVLLLIPTLLRRFSLHLCALWRLYILFLFCF